MNKSTKENPVNVNSGEIILTKSQYQNIFGGLTEFTQCPEFHNVLKTPVMFPKRGVSEPISPISEPLSADGFDWSENERNAYEL